MPVTSSSPLRVLLACSGLDHAHRGFETFARESFNALVGAERLELTLVKGSGSPGTREHSVRTITRDSAVARALGRLSGREPFRVEQFAFGLSLQRELARTRPDVIYLSEWHTAAVLGVLRRALRAEFKIAYCNGAMAAEGFGHLDRVQQLTPVALETVLARGADPRRHTLLPLGFSIDAGPSLVTPTERVALRASLGLPTERKILLSVAALNRRHKRLDYLIEEVARLPAPRPFLLMVGEPDSETPSVRELAHRHLGELGHAIRSVASTEIAAYYRASDVFVLASLGEAFGRVLVEAMANGLLCLAHDYRVTRYVLGEHGALADLSRPGALAELLSADLDADEPSAEGRHRFVYENFSWDRLRPGYVEFLLDAAANNTVSSSSGEEVFTKQR